MATDRRKAPRPGSVDRRRPESQFGRGTGSFSETVNQAFATIRQIESEKVPTPSKPGDMA